MKAFVTGISGFVGSHLAEHLLAAGDEVLGAARTGDRLQHVPTGVATTAWDLSRDPPAGELLDAVRRFEPDVIYHLAAMSIPAGLSSILNATSPMFGALIAMAWLREPSNASRVTGLGIGFVGVVLLASDAKGMAVAAGGPGTGAAIGLCLAASLLYGFSACFARRYLVRVEPLAVATGSQVSATLALALPAAAAWPAAAPSGEAWLATVALALFCTGIAYVLYFRLIARVGPARAIAVTFLVPAFAMLWAGVFLGEAVSPGMLALCALILLGTGLATGVLQLPKPARRTD